MAKIIAVFNIKGGVGKTTSAVNLAYLSAMSGKKTLLWDMDHQAASGYFLDVHDKLKGGVNAVVKDMQNTPAKRQLDKKILATPYENLDLLPSDESLRLLDIKASESKTTKKFIEKLLAPLVDHYDYIFVDCPPGLTVSNESLLYASDLVLAPVIPAVLSIRMLEELRHHIANTMTEGPAIRGFFTMMDARKNMHKEIYEQLCVRKKTIIFPDAVPYASVVEKMGIYKSPLPAFARSSKPAKAYEGIWKSVQKL